MPRTPQRGLPYEEWHFGKGGTVSLTDAPPPGVFFNRISASSHTRGHRFACEHTAHVLEWLELHGAVVVNGTRSLQLELSKVRQDALLRRAGVRTPKTVAVTRHGDEEPEEEFARRVVAAARTHFPASPFMTKHNRAGRGLGVLLWEDGDDLQDGLRDDEEAKEAVLRSSVDGTVLLQQYIRNVDQFVTRCEFIGGKLVYAVRVSTKGGFQLCPSDACTMKPVKNGGALASEIEREEGEGEEERFTILENDVFLRDHADLVARLERFATTNDLQVCGIEFIIDSATGETYVYDCNANTNYNSAAELRRFNRTPVAFGLLSDHLSSLLRKHYANEDRVVDREQEQWAAYLRIDEDGVGIDATPDLSRLYYHDVVETTFDRTTIAH